MKEISIRAGGQAGDGIASVGETVSRSLSRMGLHVFGLNAYQSVIRGGHVWFQARASPERVHSQGDACDVLYALDHQTAEVHLPSMSKRGTVVYDPEKFEIPPSEVPVGASALPVPTLEIARKYTSQSILQNAAGLGATAYLSGIPIEILQRTLADSFGKKKGEVVDWNLGAAADGYKFAQEHAPVNPNALAASGRPKLLLTGNQAIALGAAAAGCKFLAQYPMTPASTIMHWMAAHSQEIGVVVKQAEDELAAINMAIGASFGGVRAMTATSGGGFSLMVEALGMAGMTETPVVVVESQRSGPSTGLPTKTEQGDLNLMLGAGQGEFPRAILAPSNVVDAYRMTIRAFELAEAYQTPVLVASDFHLSECTATIDREEIDLNVEIPSLFTVEPNGHEYKRYLYTPSGVSPRAIPGQPGLNYIAGSDEHDEKGHLISDIKSGIPVWVAERAKMMHKRMSKLTGLEASSDPPVLEGPADAQVTFVAWGSTAAAVRDALRILAERGVTANLLFVRTLYPLHGKAVAEALGRARRPVLVEANYSGQLGHLIRAETGLEIRERLLKYDGEPFYPHEIVEKGLEVVSHGRK
ncbi:MAG TPA: 2-oxoacid:acceptor oxidoreductase subunit alpha [Thermoplasmata archaeon]|nr:2-oxoacid:acceptor oxidoreductase subunit alpha [Thermoplasmata archaeon]